MKRPSTGRTIEDRRTISVLLAASVISTRSRRSIFTKGIQARKGKATDSATGTGRDVGWTSLPSHRPCSVSLKLATQSAKCRLLFFSFLRQPDPAKHHRHPNPHYRDAGAANARSLPKCRGLENGLGDGRQHRQEATHFSVRFQGITSSA